MYRVTNGMLAEIAEMNLTAKQNFIESQSATYGPNEMDWLIKLSEELKSVAQANRSVAIEARARSRELIEKLRREREKLSQSSASISDGANTV